MSGLVDLGADWISSTRNAVRETLQWRLCTPRTSDGKTPLGCCKRPNSLSRYRDVTVRYEKHDFFRQSSGCRRFDAGCFAVRGRREPDHQLELAQSPIHRSTCLSTFALGEDGEVSSDRRTGRTILASRITASMARFVTNWEKVLLKSFKLTFQWLGADEKVLAEEHSWRVKARDWQGFNESPEDWAGAADRTIAYLIRAGEDGTAPYREPGMPVWIWSAASPTPEPTRELLGPAYENKGVLDEFRSRHRWAR